MHECFWSPRRTIFDVWGVVLSCWNQNMLRSVRYLSLRCVQKRSSMSFDHYSAIAAVDPSADRTERAVPVPCPWFWTQTTRWPSVAVERLLHCHVGTFSLPHSTVLTVNTAIKMALSASLGQASPENLGQIRHFFKKPCSGTEPFGQCR